MRRRDGREKPTSHLHTCMEGKVVEEIRNFLEWGGRALGWTTRLGVVGLAAAGLTLAAAFFFGFPAAGPGDDVVLGSGF